MVMGVSTILIYRAGGAVPQRYQANHRVRRHSIQNDRSARRVVVHGNSLRLYGVPMRRQPHRSNCQPYHRKLFDFIEEMNHKASLCARHCWMPVPCACARC